MKVEDINSIKINETIEVYVIGISTPDMAVVSTKLIRTENQLILKSEDDDAVVNIDINDPSIEDATRMIFLDKREALEELLYLKGALDNLGDIERNPVTFVSNVIVELMNNYRSPINETIPFPALTMCLDFLDFLKEQDIIQTDKTKTPIDASGILN